MAETLVEVALKCSPRSAGYGPEVADHLEAKADEFKADAAGIEDMRERKIAILRLAILERDRIAP